MENAVETYTLSRGKRIHRPCRNITQDGEKIDGYQSLGMMKAREGIINSHITHASQPRIDPGSAECCDENICDFSQAWCWQELHCCRARRRVFQATHSLCS